MGGEGGDGGDGGVPGKESHCQTRSGVDVHVTFPPPASTKNPSQTLFIALSRGVLAEIRGRKRRGRRRRRRRGRWREVELQHPVIPDENLFMARLTWIRFRICITKKPITKLILRQQERRTPRPVNRSTRRGTR